MTGDRNVKKGNVNISEGGFGSTGSILLGLGGAKYIYHRERWRVSLGLRLMRKPAAEET